MMHPETKARIKAMQEEVLSKIEPKKPVRTLRQNEGVYLDTKNTFWPDINYEVK